MHLIIKYSRSIINYYHSGAIGLIWLSERLPVCLLPSPIRFRASWPAWRKDPRCLEKLLVCELHFALYPLLLMTSEYQYY